MAKEILDGRKEEKKKKGRNPKIEFDMLQMYFGKPYHIDLENTQGQIDITQPYLGDIISIGESKFYSSLSPFITNTSAYKVMLWDLGIDWNDISDFTLFTMLYKGIDSDISKLLLNGLDIQKFEISQISKSETESEIILYDQINNIEINEEIYFHLSQYLRTCFQIDSEEKLTSDVMLKKMWVNLEKTKLNRAKESGKSDGNSLQAIISSCVNHPGFKYRLDELEKIKVYQFYDSVKRLQIYESSTALMKGMYSGMIDSSKIDAESYNFMRSIQTN